MRVFEFVAGWVALAGIRGTYQGLTATMMKQGTNQAIRFFVMESLKELYRGKDNVNKPVPKVITGVFGVVAGAASVFGNTPLDVIKTRMQVGRNERYFLPSCDSYEGRGLVMATTCDWLRGGV